MSLDFDCYMARQRMKGGGLRAEIPKPRNLLYWAIFIGYIVLVCDHQWVAQHWAERQEKFVDPFTPAYEQALKEVSETTKDFQAKVNDGTITPREAVRIQYLVVENFAKIDRDWSGLSKTIIDGAQKVYVAKWQPDERDELTKSRCNLETMREAYANMQFHKEILEAQATLPRPGPLEPIHFSLPGMIFFFWWVIKWYYLLTIPALTIFVVDMRFKGKRIKEELLLQLQRIALSALLGPIGVATLSETAAKVYRYRKLWGQFMASKPIGYRLTKEDEEVLWRQVYQPLLSFDQALESFKATGYRIRRPVLVCFLTWLLGLANHQIINQEETRTMVVITTTDVTYLETGSIDFQLPVDKICGHSAADLMLAILPSLFVWQKRRTCCAVIVWTVEKILTGYQLPGNPRGPPAIAKRQQTVPQSALCLLAVNC